MADSPRTLDYDLDAEVLIDDARQLKAMADPLRTQILNLVLERAASVTELAAAVDRPKGSVAYHVDVLVDAGLLKVVRTRKVRAIEERLYGRVARTIVYGDPPVGVKGDFIAEAFNDTRGLGPDDVSSTMRHVRIPGDRAIEFFDRVLELAVEFSELPREGDEVWALLAALYRTDHPTLPPVDDEATEGDERSDAT